jgi:hypothetical protein
MTQEELVTQALAIARSQAVPGMSVEDKDELIEKAMLAASAAVLLPLPAKP